MVVVTVLGVVVVVVVVCSKTGELVTDVSNKLIIFLAIIHKCCHKFNTSHGNH